MFKINLLCTERCNDSEVAVADINSYELLPEMMSDYNCIAASIGGDVTTRIYWLFALVVFCFMPRGGSRNMSADLGIRRMAPSFQMQVHADDGWMLLV